LNVILDPNSTVVEYPVDNHVVTTMRQVAWKDVPDMPDRVIAATALAVDAPLITLDERLQASVVKTIW
jgi:PIN domain nuclease of toxin-antitoxin system